MAVPEHLSKIFKYIDDNQQQFINCLQEAMAIKSVSAWAEKRSEVTRMVEWTKVKLEALGASCDLHDLGTQTLPNGKIISLPPVLMGQLGNDSKKKTVCIYGHLDVQPALKEDGWDTDPFVLVEKDGKLYGRGSTDDKGPVIGWLHAIEAFQKTGQDIPINIKFVFEGMEECGSEGLEDLLKAQKDKFLKDTDYVCICDTYWLGKNKPCIGYGLRGVCCYTIEVSCAKKDLHSGEFGGTIHEALPDLIYLMNTLVDKEGKIQVPGIMDQVKKVTPEEEKLYESIDFDVEDYKSDIGHNKLINDGDKMKTLMARWRFPCLSLHGIEGAYSEPGMKTVIPAKVIGKFSIRIVPDQTPEFVTKCVFDYLNQRWIERGSCNQMNVRALEGAPAWLGDYDNDNFQAASKANQLVYGSEPDLIREGGSVPITITLEEVTGKSVLQLTMGAGDDGAHSQNEKIDIRNFIQGTKVLAAYIHEFAKNPRVDSEQKKGFAKNFNF